MLGAFVGSSVPANFVPGFGGMAGTAVGSLSVAAVSFTVRDVVTVDDAAVGVRSLRLHRELAAALRRIGRERGEARRERRRARRREAADEIVVGHVEDAARRDVLLGGLSLNFAKTR